jgi:hypothetical protein
MENTLRTWGTYWEPDGNSLRTQREHIVNQGKMKKEKKQGTLSACLSLPIGCMNFLVPKEFVTIFGLG